MTIDILDVPKAHKIPKTEIKIEPVYSREFVNIYDMPASVLNCKKVIESAEAEKENHWKDSTVVGPEDTSINNPKARQSRQQDFSSINSPKVHHPLLRYSAKCLENYLEMFPQANNFSSFAVIEAYNIIRYKENEAYHALHCDFSSNFNSDLSRRHLTGVCFLNDVEEGGELMFPQQDLEIKPEAGLFVIFPSGWTHAHKTLPPVGQSRYVFQLWWSFSGK